MPSHTDIDSKQDVSKKRKRISRDTQEELPWTAARCNRLLRSITQRIATLRKLIDNDFTTGTTVPKPRRSLEKRIAGHWSTQDPVWMGDGAAKRKAGAKTFAGRKKVQKQEVCRDVTKSSAIGFPSPFVRRLGSGNVDVEICSPNVESGRRSAMPPPPKLKRQLPIKAETPRIDTENGLCAAFGSLLSATNGTDRPNERGARSLMSVCLRSVPAYIEINEEGENEEDESFASEVLDYLEGFGTKEGGGWSGLREAVRSQAMDAICKAIADRVLSERFIEDLIEQCGRRRSTGEGQDIIAAWIEAGVSVSARQVEALNKLATNQRFQDFTFRMMRYVVEEDPARSITLYKTQGFWNQLLRALTSVSRFGAADFLSGCVSSCLKQDYDCSGVVGLGVKEVFLKLTTMTASAMLFKDPEAGPSELGSIVHELAAIGIFSAQPSRNKELYHLLTNCSILLLGISQEPFGPFDPAVLANILSYDQKTRLMRSIFITDLISSITTLEQHLHTDLLTLLLERMVQQTSITSLYREIALAIITTKQQSSPHAESEALYAEYINIISCKPVEKSAASLRTPFRKPSKTQYRWEDGICEWVAKTPFTAATTAVPLSHASSTRPKLSSFDDKENSLPTPAKSCTSVQKDESPLQQNSPDVLALSPKKRRVAESPLALRQMKRKGGVVVLKREKRKSRLSTRTSRGGEGSEDELGF